MDDLLQYLVVAVGVLAAFVFGKFRGKKQATSEQETKETREKIEKVEEKTEEVVEEAKKVEEKEIEAADEKLEEKLEEIEKEEKVIEEAAKKDIETGSTETIDAWKEFMEEDGSDDS